MKELIIISLTLTAVYKVYINRKDWEYYALIWVAILCVLGYRVFPNADAHFQIHPIDLVLGFTLYKILSHKIKIKLPILLNILFVFCSIAVIRTLVDFDYNIGSALNEAKSFLLIFPCFMLTGYFIKRNQNILEFNYYYSISMMVISILGIIEYYFPSITGYFGGIYQLYKEKEMWELNASQFFDRAKFTNWGAPSAGHIILLAIPLIWSLKNTVFFKKSIVYYFVLGSLLLAIYIAGARADWILILLFIFLNISLHSQITLSMNRFLVAILGLFLSMFILVKTVSENAITRFLSGVTALQGQADLAKDSSGHLRKLRFDRAWENALDNPFGVGWANSGWVHSDIVQFSANLGWLPGLIFILFFLSIMFRGFGVIRKLNTKDPERQILAGYWIACIGIGYQFTINGNYYLTQSGVPFYLIMGLLHYYTIKMKAKINTVESGKVKVERLR